MIPRFCVHSDLALDAVGTLMRRAEEVLIINVPPTCHHVAEAVLTSVFVLLLPEAHRGYEA
jgi:hypothetical protein